VVKSNGDLFIEIGNLKKDHLLNRDSVFCLTIWKIDLLFQSDNIALELNTFAILQFEGFNNVILSIHPEPEYAGM
jgi:hypothetical protein